MAITTYNNLIKRLKGFVNATSAVLQNIFTVIASKIDELDTEIQTVSEFDQSKRKLRQVLKEWSIIASTACSVENLQNALKKRYEYHVRRGSEEGILDDIDLLCNSGANIYKDPPPLEWYLGINYPFQETSDDDVSPLDFSDACFGYLVDLGIAIRFAVDNNAMTEDEVKEFIRKNCIPIHLDAYLDVIEDSYNYLMLEQSLNWN